MALDEIAASLYAWDIADEGIDHALDVLQTRAGVNSAYLVGLMHHEKRPLTGQFYPHNPRRRYYLPEDSRVYWRPQMSRYTGRIRPLTSERDFLRDHDWLTELVDGARDHGMRTGCEISHTVFDARIARAEFPDLLQRDVDDEFAGAAEANEHGRALPCVNQPEVQDYLLSLFGDLVHNYDLDYVQTCLVLFGGGIEDPGGRPVAGRWQNILGVATGGCFCTACERRARAEGLDWDAIRAEVGHLAALQRRRGLEAVHERQILDKSAVSEASLLLENPGLVAWLQFRVRSVNALLAMVREAIRSAGTGIEFRYNTYMTVPERAGLDFKTAFAHVDSVRESDYSEQRGVAEGIEVKRAKLMKARRALRDDQRLIAALGVRPRATPELLISAVRAAVESGADGLSLGHYDGATMERLDAVAEGVRRGEGDQSHWQPA
ncbi:hypothetical protein [Microbacterium tumbae]